MDHSPLYLQLADRIAIDIRSGRLQANHALPPERELAEQEAVSRVTARKAIEHLVEQGLVVRKRGSGNYVAPSVPGAAPPRLPSFSEQHTARGRVPGSQWLKRALGRASAEEQLGLGLSPGDEVARLERLRTADGLVLAFEASAVPARLLPDPTLVDESLYAWLAAQGHTPVRAVQQVRAVQATPTLANWLGVAPGHSILCVTRVSFDASGRAVEHSRAFCLHLEAAMSAELSYAFG